MTLPKPYYDHGGITIYNADCRDILPALVTERGKFDLLLTDPPYNFGAYETDTAPAIPLIMDSASSAALWGYPEVLVQWCLQLGRAPDEWITWWPSNAACKGRQPSQVVPRHTECVAVFSATMTPAAIRRVREDSAPSWMVTPTVMDGDVWRDPSPGIAFNAHMRKHPNEKPVSVMAKLLQLCASDARTVLDPYMGSGPVARACKDAGLRYVGIEIVEKYCEIAVKRLAQEVLFA